MSAYGNDEVRAALEGFRTACNSSPTVSVAPQRVAIAILDAVAPAIAARALREFADELDRAVVDESDLSWTRLTTEATAAMARRRADEIERTP